MSDPEPHHEDELSRPEQHRLEARAKLLASGHDPYPQEAAIECPLYELRTRFEELAAAAEVTTTAGRVVSHQAQGKLRFLNLFEASLAGDALFQIMVRKNNVPEATWAVLQHAERGDHLWVRGVPLRTRRGTPSLDATEVRLTCKSTTPLPFRVTKDKERALPELDMLTHGIDTRAARHRDEADRELDPEELREARRDKRHYLRLRSRIVHQIHQLMHEHGFVHVDTPYVYPTYGGGEARPFETVAWALDNKKEYLSISPEPFLKRLICGGFDRVYTVARNFRNEGIDATHHCEFSGYELYEAHADYRQMIVRTEQIVSRCAEAVNGELRMTRTVFRDGELARLELDLTPPWPRIPVLTLVSELTGEDLSDAADDEVWAHADKLGYEPPQGRVRERNWSNGIMALLDLVVEHAPKGDASRTFHHGVCHVIDYPAGSTVLSKRHRDDPRLLERKEAHLLGIEFSNAYTELNDPVEQRERLEEQVRLRERGDREAVPMDAWFLHAVELGLPPMGGLGIGLDRVVMFLADAHDIRDVIAFPLF